MFNPCTFLGNLTLVISMLVMVVIFLEVFLVVLVMKSEGFIEGMRATYQIPLFFLESMTTGRFLGGATLVIIMTLINWGSGLGMPTSNCVR